MVCEYVNLLEERMELLLNLKFVQGADDDDDVDDRAFI
jgi:hypothetical protein